MSLVCNLLKVDDQLKDFIVGMLFGKEESLNLRCIRRKLLNVASERL